MNGPKAVLRERLDWAARTLRTLGFTIEGTVETREKAWSFISGFRTTEEIVYLKYVRGAFLHEPGLTQSLHHLAPDLVPEILAQDQDLGCWLVRSSGTGIRLPEFVHNGHVPPLLKRYAVLQKQTQNASKTWLGRGAKDVSAHCWVGFLADVRAAREALEIDNVPQDVLGRLARADGSLDRAASLLRSICPPTTIVHMDLRQTNIKIRRGTARLIDWGDAGYGPCFLDPVPLLSEIRTLQLPPEETEALNEASLQPWSEVLSPEEATTAQQICRAAFPLLYAHGLIHARPSWDPTLKPTYFGLLKFYLSTFLDRLDRLNTDKLGAPSR